MAELKDLARDHTEALVFLLESLGFIVHPEKTVKEPSQEVEFLGMKILSQTKALILTTAEGEEAKDGNLCPRKGSISPHSASSVTSGLPVTCAEGRQWLSTGRPSNKKKWRA